MSDPYIVYDGITITIPAGSRGNMQVIITPVPTDMWYSWLANVNTVGVPEFLPWIQASVITVTGGTSPTLSLAGIPIAVAGLNQFNQPSAAPGFYPDEFWGYQSILIQIDSDDAINDVVVAGLSLSLIMNPNSDGQPSFTTDWEGVPPEVFDDLGPFVTVNSCSNLAQFLNITDTLPGGDLVSLSFPCFIGPDESTTMIQAQAIPSPQPVVFTTYWTGPVNPFLSTGGPGGEPVFGSSIGSVIMFFWDVDGNSLGEDGDVQGINDNTFPGPGILYVAIPNGAAYWAMFTYTQEPVDGEGDVEPAGDSTLHIDFYSPNHITALHNFYGNLAFLSNVFTTNALAPARRGSRVTVIG